MESNLLAQEIIREAIDNYDDMVLYKQSIAFSNRFPKKINHSQLYGLMNVVQSAENPTEIIQFINHQKQKQHEDAMMISFWEELPKVLSLIRNDIDGIWKNIKLKHFSEIDYEPGNQEAGLQSVYLEIVNRFVAHIIAENGMKK